MVGLDSARRMLRSLLQRRRVRGGGKGWGWAERPGRRLLLMILFQGCGSQGRGLSPPAAGRHQNLFLWREPSRKGWWEVGPRRGARLLPGWWYVGSGPHGEPRGSQGGPDTPPTQGATHHTPQHL